MKITLKNASCLIVAIVILLAMGLSYLLTAGITWVIMWGLTALGVILPIAWSWLLALVVWFVLILLGGIFGRS